MQETKDNSKFDFEAFSKQAAAKLKAGKPMVSKDGVFTPLVTKNKKMETLTHSKKNEAKPKSLTSRNKT